MWLLMWFGWFGFAIWTAVSWTQDGCAFFGDAPFSASAGYEPEAEAVFNEGYSNEVICRDLNYAAPLSPLLTLGQWLFVLYVIILDRTHNPYYTTRVGVTGSARIPRRENIVE